MPHQIIDVVTPYVAVPGAANPELLAAVRETSEDALAQVPGMAASAGSAAGATAGASAATQAIADNPDVVAQAAALAQSDQGLTRDVTISTPRVVTTDHPDYATVTLSRDLREVGGVLRSEPVLADSITPGALARMSPLGQGRLLLTRDLRRVEPGGEAEDDGLTPSVVLAEWAQRMPVTPILSAIVGLGDSMTTDQGGVGLSQIAALAEVLGVLGYDLGVSGDTPRGIAWRVGAMALRVTSDVTLPATGAVAVQVSPSDGWRFERTWPVRLRTSTGGLIRATLTQSATTVSASPAWTLEQVGGSASVKVLAGTRIAHEQAWKGTERFQPMVVGLGRNDPDAGRVMEALGGIVATHRDPCRRMLIRPIFNKATEPSGSSEYTTVMSINASISAKWPDLYFDDRTQLITHGLALAGITPTAADTTAITEDRIPPSLMMDDTHLTVAGRRALAIIDAAEISGRNW